MSALYLKRVELNDFRTFGSFALDIPPGPGLTLLVGTNGLGKSSFFDGIEWCLTDQVSRFNKHISRLKERDYLTRRDAAPNSHKVSLHFTAGTPIIRTATIKPSETSLVELLKKNDWGDIKDLGTYLAFTHFLGQAAQQRFTSRKHNEQWEALKGPSGIDRLEEIRTTLRGRSTGNAFRRRIDEQQLHVAQAEKALIAWRDTSERLLRLQHSAAASGALPLTTFESSLAKLTKDLAAVSGMAIAPATSDPGECLIFLRQVIEREFVVIRSAVAQLEPLRAIVDRYLLLISQADQAEEMIGSAHARVADATIVLSTEILGSGTAKQAVSAQAAVVAREIEGVERLSAIRQLGEERVRLDNDRRELLAERALLQLSRDAQESALAAARPRLTQAIDAQSERLDLEARQTALNEIVGRAGEIALLESAAQAKQEKSRAADAAAVTARTTIAGVRVEITQLEGRLAAGNDRLTELRRKASDMADALARIAGHIEEHDSTCPVCASAFPPGVLKDLAEAAATSEDEGLAEQARLNHGLLQELDLKRRGLAEAERTVADATICSQEVAAAQSELVAARLAVARSLNVPEDQKLIEVAKARLHEVSSLLAPLLAAEAAGTPSVAAAQAAIEIIESELAAIRRRWSAVEERYSALASTLLRIDEKIASFTIVVPSALELAQQIEAQQLSVATAREKLSKLERERAAIFAAEASARERLGAFQAEHDRLATTIAAARRDIDATVSQWAKAGLLGVPSQESVAARTDALARRSAGLTQLLDTQSSLARAYEALLAQSEMQIVIGNMENQGGVGSASDPTVHERHLQKTLSDARESLQETESTQTAVDAYAEQLKAEADDFSTKFLEPLNDLINNFNRALLSTPGETVQFSTDLSIDRTQLGMQLRYADGVDSTLYNTDLPPQLVLSEGQMAANGFSILCAASTAYPWSNWRSLLLDDPLQHNDVIHAAAFVDVMRNLVESQGYQLIMSSHDRVESEFLARKFDAAGLPCTVLALTAPSKEGVLFESPRYNTAARDLLQTRQVKTG